MSNDGAANEFFRVRLYYPGSFFSDKRNRVKVQNVSSFVDSNFVSIHFLCMLMHICLFKCANTWEP